MSVEQPGPVELLGIEPLEEHARRLAALLTASVRSRVSSRAHQKRLRQHARVLREVYTSLANDAKRGDPSSPAAEWLLDNFHIIVAALRDIQHDLPPASSNDFRGSRPTSSRVPSRLRDGARADSLQRRSTRCLSACSGSSWRSSRLRP